MRHYGLSKSRLTAWRQCPKRLWLQIHRPDLMEVSADATRRFHIGHEVGEVAQGLFPDGILVRNDDDLSAALVATTTAMTEHPERPIFEGTFEHDGLLVRADILAPTKSGYRVIEVKSSASVKPYHLDDCAVQAWVLKQNNVTLVSTELAHIDTAFVYQGNWDYQGLFRFERLDQMIQPLVEVVPSWIQDSRQTLSGAEPQIMPGPQCDDPFECPFKTYCTPADVHALLSGFSLDIFYRMSTGKKEALRNIGLSDALEVPEEHLNDTQRWIQHVSRSGLAELGPDAGKALDDLPYPRYYLDFETINLAVPRWADTSPYRTQVPFQWSCHIEQWPGQLQHAMFLDVSGDDPRRACAETMIDTLGSTGPVFVYFEAFEKGRITELAGLYADLSPALLAIRERIVDLLPIVRAHYYHPAMKGSWSIKAVLPTIAPDLDYTHMLVGNGGDAQDAYAEIVHPQTSDVRRHELDVGLREYCKLDTLAMVRLAWFLQRFRLWFFQQDKVSVSDLLDNKFRSGDYVDALFPDAVGVMWGYWVENNGDLIVQPISLLQRRLKIGYVRAVRLGEELKAHGIVVSQQEAFGLHE